MVIILPFRLEALDPNAYEAFQASRDLRDVVDRVNKNKEASNGRPGMTKKLSVRASLMTPVLPMLVRQKEADVTCIHKLWCYMYARAQCTYHKEKGSPWCSWFDWLYTVLQHLVKNLYMVL